MKTNEFNKLIETALYESVRNHIISESKDKKFEVYHIKCEGEPVQTCYTEEEAQEHLDKLKKDHPGKQFIIEKEIYESHEDMINKLDEMGEQLEEKENQNMKKNPIKVKSFEEAIKHAKEQGLKKIKINGESYNVDECWDEMEGSMTEDEYNRPSDTMPEYEDWSPVTNEEEKECDECGQMEEEKDNIYTKVFNALDQISENADEQKMCECGGMINEEGMCNECGKMHEQKEYDDFDTQITPEELPQEPEMDDLNDKEMEKKEEPKKFKPFRPGVNYGKYNLKDLLHEEKLCECGGMINEEGMCNECGKMYEEHINESKNKVVRLNGKEFKNLINKIVSESVPGVPGITVTKRSQAGSKKENNAYINDVEKKMKKYLSIPGNDNPEFPHQVGVEQKKMATKATEEEVEEIKKNQPGMQNLKYDIEPSKKFKERMEMSLKGDSKMGNAAVTPEAKIKPSNGAPKGKASEHKSGLTIPTPDTAEYIKKQMAGRKEDMDNRTIYPKEKVPITLKNFKKKLSEEKNESKEDKVLSEEIQKMKKMASYNEKTQ
jgi:hypothetical protein